ncbi:beta family protein [Tahibacter soli]|uniref:Beta family protein n=1 Tax=Tahibacter soli TaxID=2983605 RepID=A0A9X3YFJ7_9GAMM|nr:beta family protein [Tahibacter soli]MDC8010956.1 beta family protein [Tahibacter soli]
MSAYRPIAKLKQNDVQAFNLLKAPLRRTVSPIFEMLRMPDDGDAEKHLAKTLGAFDLYGDGATPIVDLDRFLPKTTVFERHPADWGYDSIFSKQKRVIPVLSMHADASSLDVLVGAAEKHRQGICLRLDGEDVALAPEKAIKDLSARVGQIGILARDADLLIDFAKLRYLRDPAVIAVLRFLGLVDGYGLSFRNVIFAGSTVVDFVSEAAAEEHTTGSVRRDEFSIWTRLIRAYGWGRRLQFSDYGIVRPEHMDNVRSKYTNGKVRYTAGGSIHYFRGCRKDHISLKDQYPDIVRRLVASDVYKKPGYSNADDFFWSVAQGRDNTGSTGRWVRLDMNHHLTYVAQQVEAVLALGERERASDELVDAFAERF